MSTYWTRGHACPMRGHLLDMPRGVSLKLNYFLEGDTRGTRHGHTCPPHTHSLAVYMYIYAYIYVDVCTGIYISVEGVYLTLCVYEYIYK